MGVVLDGLIDAQAMASEHPETFSAPSSLDLSLIESGNPVKICRNDERFWVIVTDISDNTLTGEVNNRLTNNEDLSLGDPIVFEKRHIYQIDMAKCPNSQELFGSKMDAILDIAKDIEDPYLELDVMSVWAGLFLSSFPVEVRKSWRRALVKAIDEETRDSVIRGCDA